MLNCVRSGVLVIGWCVSASLALAADGQTSPAIDADILLRQGVLHRGDGQPPEVGDVAIQGDRIVAVGQFACGRIAQQIDCRGLVVCPGFIDLHNHSDEALAQSATRAVVNYVTQGCTTIVTGNCGFGPTDVGAYYRRLDEQGIGVNVAHLVPQGSVRQRVMNSEQRAATADELLRMTGLVQQAMLEGAWGMSSGLIYVPSSYADTAELAALATAVAEHGGIYASHIRNENVELLTAIDEALQIGQRGGLPVHISHFKSSGKDSWGLVRVAAETIEQARRQGQQVTADQYPYTASSTSLEATLLPTWARAGGNEAMLRRLDDATDGPRIREAMAQQLVELDDGQRLQIAAYAAEPTWAGRRLSELAAQQDMSSIELALRILRNGGASIVNHSINEQDVRFVMTLPWVATASDGGANLPGASVPHPRNYGTFPRKMGYYALQEHALELTQAIRSASGLPADILGLADRGYLRPGMMADVIAFDPDAFRDQATFTDPHQYSVGLSLVLVNGQIALRHGIPTGNLAGRALCKRSKLALTATQQAAVDQRFARWDRADSPGCALGIFRRGQLIYQRGYGSANLDQQIPLTSNSVFYLASVSKQFVAACVGLLVLDGKLSLDDDVRRHIPELPEYGRTITIDHLVHHTSGLRDYLMLMDMAGMPFGDQHTRDELLGLICRQRELNFAPGERYAYCNSGYFLLAEIVQRVSGQSLAEFARQRIFEPLEMRQTSFHDDSRATVPDRVLSYQQRDQRTEVAYLSNWDQVGSGGLLSTVGDLLRWDRNFEDKRLGGQALWDLMHTRGTLADGRQIGYAFGLEQGEHRGVTTWSHGGSFMGFRTALVRVPDEHVTVAVLANEASVPAEDLARGVLDICLADRLAAALHQYEGQYHSDELPATITVRVEGIDLVMQRMEQAFTLVPSREIGTYRLPQGRVVFERGAGGVTGFRLGGEAEGGGVRFARLGPDR